VYEPSLLLTAEAARFGLLMALIVRARVVGLRSIECEPSRGNTAYLAAARSRMLSSFDFAAVLM